MNRYTCRAYEWDFAVLFSTVAGSSKGHRYMPYIGCIVAPIIWLVLFGLYGVLHVVLPQNQSSFLWIKEGAIVIGLVIGAFIFIRSFMTRAKSVKVAKVDQSIDWLMTSDKGISINMFNDMNSPQLPFYYWHSIESLHLDITKELRFYTGGRNFPHLREQRIAEYNEKYPNYQVHASDNYKDRFTLILNRHKPFKQAVIQIPQSWLVNGQLTTLLQAVEANTGLTTEPYDELAKERIWAWMNSQHRE